jgi:uncharacterized membrane protein
MAKNGIEMILAGAVIGAVVMLVAMVALGVNPAMTTAALSSQQQAQASATVKAFVETSITGGTSVTFGELEPGVNDSYATSAATVITNTGNSNSKIDIYIKSTDLTNSSYVIKAGNLSVSQDNSTGWARLVSTGWLNGTSANSGYYENVTKNSAGDFYFKIDIPSAQDAAEYAGTITIKSVKDGETP